MRAVHFGAGNIGRGFIGETLADNGFGIDFVDVNETIIDELRKENYQVVIVSTRCSTEQGIIEMTEWLNKYDIEVDRIDKEKPPALIYVDDRAICFDGNTQHLWDSIISFKTWQENKSIKISSIVTMDDECTYKNVEVKNISSLQELDKAIDDLEKYVQNGDLNYNFDEEKSEINALKTQRRFAEMNEKEEKRMIEDLEKMCYKPKEYLFDIIDSKMFFTESNTNIIIDVIFLKFFI